MQPLNINLFNIIIVSGVVYGILFSFTILTQKKFITNNTAYLAFTVLFLSLSNLQYWFLDTHMDVKYPFLKYTYVPWHWLIMPMFYIYVNKFLFNTKARLRNHILAVIPFFIALIIDLIYLFENMSVSKVASHFERGLYSYLEIASIVFNFIILYTTYKVIKNFENSEEHDNLKIKPQTAWLKQLIYRGIVICICWLIGISLIVFFDVNRSYVFYPMWLGISFLVYWIGYAGVNKSMQLKELLELRKKRLKKDSESNTGTNKTFIQLEKTIITQQLFLFPDLTLNKLSKELNLSEGYISQLINSSTNFNFNDFINQLRVNEAKSLLSNPEFDHYTIESIGLECGFNSKSIFYSAFKKFEGKTPAFYKKEVRNL